ncbi:hypothetical protein JW930_07170 [Candidatus Woesearchaeota archaeon]|nr:hypothetical protein [Candidatus Woesearchaeota archaeon]
MKERAKIVAVMTVVLLLSVLAVIADPLGTDLTYVNSSRRTAQSPQTQDAQAGNVTRLDINQTKITDVWQGFYGNISGSITLDDAGNHTFYDWSMTAITGEVYATRETVADWATINCSNSTYMDNEHSGLGITGTWADSINNTYTSTSHDAFSVGNRPMASCPSTQAYDSTGAGAFWNVMLAVYATGNPVYTTIINEDNDGFDGYNWDFELLVPTNYTNGGTATYYFYVELN